MVIGTGLIASALDTYKNDKNVVIFASGVSDSTETADSEFEREKSLLVKSLKLYPDALFVYFSTYSIVLPEFKDRPYTLHKREMEAEIERSSNNYLICRLSNIVGGSGNDSNVFNFLCNSVAQQRPINIWKNATRNLLDVEDMRHVLVELINNGVKNRVVTIANQQAYSVEEMVARIEQFFGKSIIGEKLDKGMSAQIDVSEIQSYLDSTKRDFSPNYIDYLLKKYHG